HDHKYDPLLQKEFYQFYAYFNNIPERGMSFKYGNSPPFIQAPTPEQQAKVREIEQKISDADHRVAALRPKMLQTQREWEKGLDPNAKVDWSISEDLVYQHGIEQLDGKNYVNAGDEAKFGFYDKFTLSAWVNPTAPNGAILSKVEDVEEGNGYGLYLKNGKVWVVMANRWLDDGARLETVNPLPLNQWSHVALTYDGTRMASGIKIYVNGRQQQVKVDLDVLNQTCVKKEPLRIGGGGGLRFAGSIDGVRIYKNALMPGQVAVLATRESISEIAAVDPPKRTGAQDEKIRLCFLDRYAAEDLKQASSELNALRRERQQLLNGLPTVMVMQERPTARDTFILVRGAYDKLGEKVSRGVPSVLPPLPADAPNDRLGLARWIASPSNPLTARVLVNRLWQMYFG